MLPGIRQSHSISTPSFSLLFVVVVYDAWFPCLVWPGVEQRRLPDERSPTKGMINFRVAVANWVSKTIFGNMPFKDDMNRDFRFFAANPSKLADVDFMSFIFQLFLWPWFQSTVEISDVTLYSKMTFGLRISMVFVMHFFGDASFCSTTVDGRNPAPVEVSSLSRYLQSFLHPTCCRISSINEQSYCNLWYPHDLMCLQIQSLYCSNVVPKATNGPFHEPMRLLVVDDQWEGVFFVLTMTTWINGLW